MTLPFKPHVLALLCCAGLLAAAGTLYVKSREPQTVAEPAAVVQTAQTAAAAQPVTTTYTSAQIDQWVAPIALYPDNLLSQVLMAATYPSNVLQAVQWSQDHPAMKGDAAVQAVVNQPWDPSVKSLVAFPSLLALMGENPPWVENLGNAFLAQPQDVMDSVQRLRAIARQSGTLKSTPQQKVTTSLKDLPPPRPQTKNGVAVMSTAPPAPTVIKIESTDPNVVYVPAYNPSVVYGSWPNTAYPPVYLPPPPGEQFTDSFVKGFGYSLGVATTYALFSSIDWDDDDHHHHDDDDRHHDDDHHGGYAHNGDNININVNNFNHITGQNLPGDRASWQHNPAWRGNVPYPNDNVARHFQQTNVPGGLSAPQQSPGNRKAQRQAAMTQLQQRSGPADSALNHVPSRDAQRQAASQKLHQVTQRNNYRGYDAAPAVKHSPAQQSHREAVKTQIQHPTAQQQQRREQFRAATPEQRQQKLTNLHANALSGNDARSPAWQSQQKRGLQSRHLSGLSSEQRSAAREHLSEHHELRRR